MEDDGGAIQPSIFRNVATMVRRPTHQRQRIRDTHKHKHKHRHEHEHEHEQKHEHSSIVQTVQ